MPTALRRDKYRTVDRVLPAVRPNAGITAAYQRCLDKLLQEMRDSVTYWLHAAYKANEPHIAQDELPAAALRDAIRKLARRWQRRWADAAPQLADYFAKSMQERSDAALRSILKKAGISVEFRLTPATQDILRATISENVNLIKSIPQEYFTDIEGAVMRSVQVGRDLGSLAKELEEHYGVTKRRAALIARDQNNKCTAAIDRSRKIELELYDNIWLHSHAGKTPRPTHVAMDGKHFDIRKGMWDSAVGKYVWPGTEVGSRCLSKAVVKGFT